MMVKILFCCLLIFCSLQEEAQKKFATDSGTIDFVSNAELELIRASSNKLQGIIDPGTNQFAFSIPVQSFRGFNSELQREHFNEKYMESDKYPRISFSGKIIEQVDYTTDGTYEVRAKGDLDVHGQKQTRIIKTKFEISEGVLSIVADFKVPLADHNIAIPRIVNQKIATEIEVSVKADMMLR
ncbi:MAG TPA: YceI family protein [Chryseolinea sp.]|nr:YceI family protein [Chryseolinea sp.]